MASRGASGIPPRAMAGLLFMSMAGLRAALGSNVLLNPEVLQSSPVSSGDLSRCLELSRDDAGASPVGGDRSPPGRVGQFWGEYGLPHGFDGMQAVKRVLHTHFDHFQA